MLEYRAAHEGVERGNFLNKSMTSGLVSKQLSVEISSIFSVYLNRPLRAVAIV